MTGQPTNPTPVEYARARGWLPGTALLGQYQGENQGPMSAVAWRITGFGKHKVICVALALKGKDRWFPTRRPDFERLVDLTDPAWEYTRLNERAVQDIVKGTKETQELERIKGEITVIGSRVDALIADQRARV